MVGLIFNTLFFSKIRLILIYSVVFLKKKGAGTISYQAFYDLTFLLVFFNTAADEFLPRKTSMSIKFIRN